MNKIAKRLKGSLEVGIATFRREKAARLALGAGTVAATLGALAPAVHAQVTFSATAPQAALVTVTDGATDFFWDNAPGVVLIVAAIGIVIMLAMLVIRKLGGKKKLG